MKSLITESDIISLNNRGINVLQAGKSDIITPLASDKIRELGIIIVKKEAAAALDACDSKMHCNTALNKVVIGCDHTGYKAKLLVIKYLTEKGYEILDVGTFDEQSCDYPDFAFAAALKVKERKAAFGIVIDATGIPSSITANKVKGIRAAVCYNEFSARSAREHNNANILSVGAKTLGEETIKSILDVWLSTNFGGGRHQKRLDKITAVEEKNL